MSRILGDNLADRLATTGAAPRADWDRSDAWVTFGQRLLVLVGALMIALGSMVSINGAVVSSGTVNVEGNYQTVQHFDGGIISKIHVRDGDTVAAGDILMTLDKTTPLAELTVVAERIGDLLIQRNRLEAERDGRTTFAIPPLKSVSEGLRKVVATQQALFNARIRSYQGEISVLMQRIDQVSAQLDGLRAQLAASRRERSLIAEDLTGVRKLFKQGYANRQRLSGLERDAARLEGDIGRLTGDIARAEGALAETRLNLDQRRKTFIEAAIDELKTVQASLNELEERQKSLEARVARSVIRAPRGGRIHALALHTEGGVVEAAKPLMQIIPRDDRLLVKTRIQPQDVDNVRPGQHATIRFPAFNARVTPRLDGRVLKVSPAELTGDRGETYFTADVEIPAETIRTIGGADRLVPGMPAEVYITTEARSILNYFLRPLTDAMFRAFREE
jgi:HlyD family secretion protein